MLDALVYAMIAAVPWIALLGGLVLSFVSLGRFFRLSPTAIRLVVDDYDATCLLLLGAALTGLGATYVLTHGSYAATNGYKPWLGLAVISGLLAFGRSEGERLLGRLRR